LLRRLYNPILDATIAEFAFQRIVRGDRVGTAITDDGIITYSGVVHDESTRTSITDAVKGVFGADKVKGDITINANAGPRRGWSIFEPRWKT
jgi:osmotically-inducible protein OsmY